MPFSRLTSVKRCRDSADCSSEVVVANFGTSLGTCLSLFVSEGHRTCFWKLQLHAEDIVSQIGSQAVRSTDVWVR